MESNPPGSPSAEFNQFPNSKNTFSRFVCPGALNGLSRDSLSLYLIFAPAAFPHHNRSRSLLTPEINPF
jgi:hypothetical protein